MRTVLAEILTSTARILGLNPVSVWRQAKGIPAYWKNYFAYRNASAPEGKFLLSMKSLYPVYADRFQGAGSAKGHYFYQDLWAAKKIYERNPESHIDIGSRLDGFISHLLVFRTVTVLDVRPLSSNVDGLLFEQGDITKLKYADNSIDSLSCLHAIEHIGLGRYGDAVDYYGWEKGLGELQRVLKPGGRLYLGVPIGVERLFFDAHRVFDPKTVLDTLNQLKLLSFSYVNDSGDLLDSGVDVRGLPEMKYGCGLFEFTKAFDG